MSEFSPSFRNRISFLKAGGRKLRERRQGFEGGRGSILALQSLFLIRAESLGEKVAGPTWRYANPADIFYRAREEAKLDLLPIAQAILSSQQRRSARSL